MSKTQTEGNGKLIVYVLNGYVEKDDLPYVNLAFCLSESKIEEEKEKWIREINHVIQCENYECKEDSQELIEGDWDREICPKCENPKKSTVEWDRYETFRIVKIEIKHENN